MPTFFQDLRFGLRMLVKHPGFSAVAVLTLALGIGANTALFQLLDAVRLRMLPVNRPQELVEVRLTQKHGRLGSFYNWHAELTNALWEQIRDRQQAFSGVFAWAPDEFNLAPQGEARLVHGIWVSGDFFQTLGVRPLLGRVFTPADDRHGCGAPGVVISYSLWQREFGGDRSVVGRHLTIDYHPVEVLGVTPETFFGLEVGRSFDVALPICSQPLLGGEDNYVDTRYAWWLTVMGRLKPGWTLDKASAYLGSISPGIFEATLPPNYDPEHIRKYLAFKLGAYPAGNGISPLRGEYLDPLGLLLAIAGLVLLIACANLANLMLARASTREREFAVRLALGAPRRRLIRQLLVESLLLAASGASLAVLLAGSVAQFLVAFLSPAGNPVFLDLTLDWRVFAFTAGAAMLTLLLFGLAPALRATRIAPAETMKAGGRGLTAERPRFGLRPALVVSQVALSLVLLVGALLFTRTLRNLLTADLGFRRSGILITTLDLTRLNLPPAPRLSIEQQLLERLRAIPGVDSAAEASIIPTSGSSINLTVWIDGADPARARTTWINWISSEFFQTMGTRIVAGRDFDDHDTPASPKVAIVNEAFARQIAGDTNPIGKRFWQKGMLGDAQIAYEIVGLVGDTKYQGIREGFAPVAYLPATQQADPDPYPQILIRSDAPLPDLTSRIKGVVAGVNRDVALNIKPLSTLIRDGTARERLMAMLSGFFAVLAVLLAAVGLYGVMAYAVARRTSEIGIRMALGASGGEVLRMVMRESLKLVAWGVGLGLLGAVGAVRLIANQLYGLKAADPVTFAAAAFLLALVAALAGYLPARRATKVDPMVALRYE